MEKAESRALKCPLPCCEYGIERRAGLSNAFEQRKGKVAKIAFDLCFRKGIEAKVTFAYARDKGSLSSRFAAAGC